MFLTHVPSEFNDENVPSCYFDSVKAIHNINWK